MTTLTRTALAFGGVGLFGVVACSKSTSERGASSPGQTSADTYAKDAAQDARAEQAARRPNAALEANDAQLRPASRSSTAQAIAEARCARERRCESIGPDGKYVSSDACVTHVHQEWQQELATRDCSGGVDPSKLQACLTAIRTEDCNSAFEALDRIGECAATEICETNEEE